MKVSVVVPVYNVEPYVQECLDSLSSQTLDDFEVICIHDAGQDRSWEVVKAAAGNDPRIRLFENEKNIGLAATRNRGLKLASGKYVYFLDSDDMVRPDMLQTLYERAEKEHLEVQIFGASFLYETEELKESFHLNHAVFKQEYPNVVNGRDVFLSWMDSWDWLSSQPRYFYRRSFLENNRIRYMEGILHEDEAFAFEVLLHAKKVRVSNDLFFIRRFRKNSIMTSAPTVKNVEGCVRILQRVSSLQDFYADDPKWNRAVKFYMYKIFCDVCRKYRAAAKAMEKENQEPLIRALSENMRADPAAMTIYHLIETFCFWGGEA